MFTALGGVGLMLSGCPEPQTCAFDSDCDGTDICVSNSCIGTCQSDDDCILDEECLPRPTGTGDQMTCQLPSDNTNQNQVECTENSDCDESIGEFCDEQTNTCVGGQNQTPAEQFFTVRVHDVTTDRCDDDTYGFITAGTKLMHVALLDSDGQTVLHYGTAVEVNYGVDDDGFEVFFGVAETVIDGSAPDYLQHCPLVEDQWHERNQTTIQTNFNEDYIVALGCDGDIFVRFFDGDNNPVEIEDHHIIEVNEYGPFCSEVFQNQQSGSHAPQTGDDFYNVYICDDGLTTQPIDINDCFILNGAPATGRTSHPVSPN